MNFDHQPLRLKLDDKYSIHRDDHIVSSFYNDMRRELLAKIGAVEKRDDNNLELRLISKPMAVEKSNGDEPRILNTEALKQRSSEYFPNEMVIQEFILSRNR